ncbi:hypothetical protein HPP92_008714 [Vanilla planifolia]|uniref:Cytochrome P450 n=1 Tax=Vanilla planifolia TaxID=51239 RepID=A0A835R8W8_VANPL|nr:hypothetical protein HPP92_008714 [Vanilla planifolia]
MEFWASVVFSVTILCLSVLLRHVFRGEFKTRTTKPPLPPAAPVLPVFSQLFIHRRSIFEIAPLLRRFHSLYGPIISLRLFPFSRPMIFISDSSAAHAALVHQGASFADRPRYDEPQFFLSAGQHDINSSHYGSLWRLLRRNLSSETLNPSKIRLFAPARRWALQILLEDLRSRSDGVISLKESIGSMTLFLLVFMCFGVKLSLAEVRRIESPVVFILGLFTSFNVFAILPTVTKVLFHKRWEAIVEARKRQAEVFLPLIRARKEQKESGGGGGHEHLEYCYVDSLLELRIPEEGGRKLTDDEMVCLCHEFIAAGMDTSTTALEWTMAELVKKQSLQTKLAKEIDFAFGSNKKGEIMEEDLQRIPYLKAVVMEGLRRHPPAHFLLPHSVTEDVLLNGYLIPKGAKVLFEVMELNQNPKQWKEPMEFKPERFLSGGEGERVDITGIREIKMMSFGAGRRMCPGYGLAMLLIEFFLANLVWKFEWKAVAGDEVDLSEKLEFTTVMKNPLRSQIFPRMHEE